MPKIEQVKKLKLELRAERVQLQKLLRKNEINRIAIKSLQSRLSESEGKVVELKNEVANMKVRKEKL